MVAGPLNDALTSLFATPKCLLGFTEGRKVGATSVEKRKGVDYDDESGGDGREKTDGLGPVYLSGMSKLGGMRRSRRLLFPNYWQEWMHRRGERLHLPGMPCDYDDEPESRLLLHQGFGRRTVWNVGVSGGVGLENSE